MLTHSLDSESMRIGTLSFNEEAGNLVGKADWIVGSKRRGL